MRHTPQFWIERSDAPDEVLMDADQVRACNFHAFESDPHLVDMACYPDSLDADVVREGVCAVSHRPATPLHHAHGQPFKTADWRRLEDACALNALPAVVKVRFAMAHQRAAMRSWPKDGAVFRDMETRALDRFQENVLFPGDIVAVLHSSADGQWRFVQSYNYAAWVRADALAAGERSKMLQYRNAAPALVVTGGFIEARFDDEATGVPSLSLEMGAHLPPAETPRTENGDFRVRLPVAGADGGLCFATATIDAGADVHQGELPFTRRHLVEQAFKFLGEPYGWGHADNARDCTGLVSEVYRTMGIVLPRNSAQQGRSPVGVTTVFAEDADAAHKLARIRRADVGDLLYSTGHVMMFLGNLHGEPWVIHDLAGAGWTDADGRYHERRYSGVSVTPLVSLHMSREQTYLDEMYAIKTIRTKRVGES